VNGANSPLTQPNILLDSKGSEYLVPNVRGLKIASLNINSLLKHMDQLRVCMFKQQVDILAFDINGTKLDSDVPQDLIFLEGYTWISRNRNRFGVGFFIRNTINYRTRFDLNNQDIEMITIEIIKQIQN
jgi:exonuclease III